MTCMFGPLLSALLLLVLGYSAFGTTSVIEQMPDELAMVMPQIGEAPASQAQAIPQMPAQSPPIESPLAQPQQGTGRLVPGQAQSGELSASISTQEWTFDGSAGDLILIDMRSDSTSDLDCYLTLLDTSGAVLLTDDDSGLSLNARIGPTTLPATGTYTVQSTAFSGTGVYTIELLNLNALPVLEIGVPVSGVIDASHQTDFYQLPAVAPGELLRVVARQDSDRVLPWLDLYGPNGLITSTEYNGGDSLDPIISQAGELYIVGVSWDGYSSGGPYEVSLESSEIVLLTPGASQTVQLDYDNYTGSHFFEAEAGQVFQLTARIDGGLSLAMDVMTTDRVTYVFSASGGQTRALAVEFEIPETGMYMIEVRDGSYSSGTGTYTITLASPGG